MDPAPSLITHLLTLARLESEATAQENARIDLNRLIQDVSEDAEFEAQSHNRKVRVVRSEQCFINGNEHLLRSAIENVVRNAVRYTAEGSEVEITLDCRGDGDNEEAVIGVQDQGAGVPQAALSSIFLPFYRVADARDRTSGGTGLGLAISQRAVRLHGGTITASNAPGGGLLVEIALPINPGEAKIR